jgi:hypothetical protein
MGLRVTIDVFSGRPNPSIELDNLEAAQLMERLALARLLEPGEPDLPPEPTLGYRGVIIEQTGERPPDPIGQRDPDTDQRADLVAEHGGDGSLRVRRGAVGLRPRDRKQCVGRPSVAITSTIRGMGRRDNRQATACRR